ncbi:hypothetical protein [Bradyrhizobium ganzhouense]|uniref:hypothetical protein n=1 Tax=Bradyrhizobium ganzhouense TaxID=1179767 RepID=UPI003CF0E85F
MTELNISNDGKGPGSPLSPETVGTFALVGVLVVAVSQSLAGWAESLERNYRRGLLLKAYRRRHEWKKSDLSRLEKLDVNPVARRRMQAVAGLGRPVVSQPQSIEEFVLERLNAFSVLLSPESSAHDRRRCFRTWPWWKHHVEAYYRGELRLAQERGEKGASAEAEIRVGAALGLSSSLVHSICGEIRLMRQDDEQSANFPEETIRDYERWMNHGPDPVR